MTPDEQPYNPLTYMNGHRVEGFGTGQLPHIGSLSGRPSGYIYFQLALIQLVQDVA